MKTIVFSFASVVALSILSAGACGGNSDSSASASDASVDGPRLYKTSVPDDYVPYTPLTTKCVAAPYADPTVEPDAAFLFADAGDDDAGPSIGLPQLVSFGGPVLTAPRIVPITYLGDPLADAIEDFVGSVGCTDYWRSAVSEYGVGQAEMLPPVRLTTAAPASISDAAITTFLGKQIQANAPGFANPPADVIFAVYLPSGTTVELEGTQSCSNTSNSFLGYHSSFTYSGKYYAYAVIARCNGDLIDDVTNTSSHEFAEASTDPVPNRNPAYATTDDDHIAFSFLGGGGEAGDLCVFAQGSSYTPTNYPFQVQRIWSNASLLAGHNPCVPTESGPWVVAIPEQPDTVPIQNTGVTTSTRGVAIPVGGSRTIDIHFHTDDPATTQWTLAADDASQFLDGTKHLNLVLDTTTATPDGIAHLTITRTSKSAVYGVEIFDIRSTANGNGSSWVGVVGDPQ
jgi:hypothetical protein